MYRQRFSTYKIFLLFAVVLFSQSSPGQSLLEKKVKITQRHGSTLTFLHRIEQSTGIVLSYSSELCFFDDLVCPYGEATVQQLLVWVFKDCPPVLIEKKNKIIIKRGAVKPEKYTISGYVRNAQTHEVLIGANIYDVNRFIGTTSNNFGFYSFTLPEGFVSLNCSYVGYQKFMTAFELHKDTTIIIDMQPRIELKEVAVMGVRVPAEIASTATGTVEVPIDQIRSMPVFMGEVDVLKSIQMLPGIQSGGEGFSGLYVRGGGPDQNLILLDDVPVYNVGHMLGLFSIFNADAINKVSVIKGGFPARFGGRLSSVVDIRTYDGNGDKFNGSAGIGLLSSRVSLNGPILKDKLLYSFSFRRTYYDLIAAPFQAKRDEKSRYYFFDLNGKLSYYLSDKDKFYISSYWGKDEYKVKFNTKEIYTGEPENPDAVRKISDDRNSGWGNLIISGKWNHQFGDKLYSNLTAIISDYRFYVSQTQNYQLGERWNYIYQKYFSGIRDFGFKLDMDYMPSAKHYIRFGGSYTQHSFYPGIDVVISDVDNISPVDTTYGGRYLTRPETHLYIEDDFNLIKNLKMNVGVHLSSFLTEHKNYTSLEPRILGRYLITNRISVKGSFSLMTQYVHLLKTANVALPTDMWLPVSDNIKPMRARQSSLGIEWSLKKNILFSVEGYLKRMTDILDVRSESSFFDYTLDWEEMLVSGDGTSKGVEFLVHKKSGKLSGWLGYTYSKTMNRFDELNDGKEFPATTDRRHDVSLYMSYRFNKRIDGGLTWMYGSGTPITLPSDKYYAPQLPTVSYEEAVDYNLQISERNGYRMPSFHRLDLGFNFRKEKKWGVRIWSAGIVNVYGRQNPFFLFFNDNYDPDTGETDWSLKQFSLFPFPIPYVRFTIKF
jgi:outer membrane cobalamin receptor